MEKWLEGDLSKRWYKKDTSIEYKLKKYIILRNKKLWAMKILQKETIGRQNQKNSHKSRKKNTRKNELSLYRPIELFHLQLQKNCILVMEFMRGGEGFFH